MFHWIPLTFLFALGVCSLGTSCRNEHSDGGEHSDSGEPSDGGEPSWEEDPYCHYDCFGYNQCTDGTVTTIAHAPVPCDEWQGRCPRYEAYQCERGCRTDIDSTGPFQGAESMCEEYRPKLVGDPCEVVEHCLPEVAVVEDGVVVENVYLECNVELGQCVAREPPLLDGWLEPCGFLFDEYPTSYSYGVGVAELCPGEFCLFMETDKCVLQGCTASCEGDGDCPIGSKCHSEWKVCKPGAENLIGVDLECP